MTVLVTGASGLLGSRLTATLVADQIEQQPENPVRVFVRRPLDHPLLEGSSVTEYRGDITDRTALVTAMTGCREVYHVAGLVSYRNADWDALRQVNIAGTEAVVTAARSAGVKRVVVTGSTAAIGMTDLNDTTRLTEDSPWREEWDAIPYMQTKREGEQLALNASDSSLEVVVVSPTTIYGAGDVKLNTGQVFRKLAREKLSFAPPGGTSVVSVADCVNGHRLAMKTGTPGERYLLSTSDHSYHELFERIAETLTVSAPSRTLPRRSFPFLFGLVRLSEAIGIGSLSRHVVRIGFQNRFFDSSKARTELGWEPTQSVEEMVSEATDFYREHDLL